MRRWIPLVLAACGSSGGAPADSAVTPDDLAIDADDTQPLPAVPLHAQSRWILGADGKRVKLASVNWYGAEEKDFVVAGLDHADLGAIAKMIRAQGFNSVRLPWSNEMFESDPVVSAAKVSANPALAGKHAMEVFDAVIAALAHEGLMVILDNHSSNADWCCSTSDGNTLWYNAQYPESAWRADWKAMVARYASQPAVIAADLRNEPRGSAAWGGGNASVDWRAAATRGANDVLDVNPALLVIVEGINYATDLTGVYGNPIDLGARQDRLVYEAHDYSFDHTALINSSSPQYSDLKTTLGNEWGYILTQGKTFTAPIWVGEFGTCHSGQSCVAGTNGIGWWFQSIRQYLIDADIDWGYWALNGTQATGTGRTFGSEESYGILNTSWTEPALPQLLTDLQAIQPVTQQP